MDLVQVERRIERGRSADERHVCPTAPRRLRDREAHAARRAIGEVPDVVNGLVGRPRGDENAFRRTHGFSRLKVA